MCARETGSTDNFTPAPEGVLPLSQADYDIEYKFVGENPNTIMALFAWETFSPTSVEDFLELSLSARSCSWCPDGQAVTMELKGTNAKTDCIQISATEFRSMFAPLGSSTHLDFEENQIRGKIDRVIN
jgi:hypothetical protein